MIPPGSIRLLAGLAVVLAAAGAGWTAASWRADTALSDLQARHAQALAAAHARAAEADRAMRAREAAIAAAVERIADEMRPLAQAVEADRRRAAAAAGGLRDAVHAVAAQCTARAAQSPGAAASGPPARAPGDLLADVLGRLDAAAGDLAAHADAARVAGLTCERAYDAVRR